MLGDEPSIGAMETDTACEVYIVAIHHGISRFQGYIESNRLAVRTAIMMARIDDHHLGAASRFVNTQEVDPNFVNGHFETLATPEGQSHGASVRGDQFERFSGDHLLRGEDVTLYDEGSLCFGDQGEKKDEGHREEGQHAG